MDNENKKNNTDEPKSGYDYGYVIPDEMRVSSKDKSLIAAILIIVLVIAAMAVAGFLFIKPEPDTVQGQADATEIRISGKLPGRVADIYVEEGQRVKMGDTLIHIHSTTFDALHAQANANVSVAEAANAKVDAGTRKQLINSAYEVWQQSLAAVSITKKTYDRMENLFSKGVVSAQKRDEAKAAYDAAVSGSAAARSQYDLAVAGAQKEDKDAAQAMVRSAQSGVQQVNAILEDQYLVAPCDGEIVVIYPHVSELVALGAPLMSLQTDNHYVVFNLRENMLKNIKNGSTIKVKIPALDVKGEAEVYYVRDMGSYANWQATKATGDYDARTFKVKARMKKKIDNLRPGMSVLLEQ